MNIIITLCVLVAAALVVSLNYSRNKSRDVKRVPAIEQIETALVIYTSKLFFNYVYTFDR